MPRWVARVNRRFLNPRALEQGSWPVLRHVGRVSGRDYRTPLGAMPVEGGFVVNLVYGRSTEWLRNVLAAGQCVLEIDGREERLTDPRIVPLTELAHLGHHPGRTERALRITEALLLTRPEPRPEVIVEP